MEHNKLYKLSKLLLFFPMSINNRRVLAAEVNCGKPPLIINDSKVTDWFLNLPTSFTVASSKKLWTDFNLPSGIYEKFFSFLKENGIILESSSEKENQWLNYGWNEAHSYHQATRDYPFLDMGQSSGFIDDEERMEDFKKVSCPPNIYQSLNSIESYPLKKIESYNSLDDKNFNRLPDKPITQEQLSIIFDLCFGERKKIDFGIQGHFLQKAIPSGGARHTTEVFFAYFNNAPLKNGIYHYNVKNNSLDLLKRGNFYNELADYTLDLFTKYKSKPFGLIIFTCLYERAMWRYRDARSWRATMIDIGHAMLIFRTVCQKLGFDYYSYQKFKDKGLSNLLGVDMFRQTPLYVTTIV